MAFRSWAGKNESRLGECRQLGRLPTVEATIRLGGMHGALMEVAGGNPGKRDKRAGRDIRIIT
eukprot:3397076-Lingulodinium_polyedra.AAC.1